MTPGAGTRSSLVEVTVNKNVRKKGAKTKYPFRPSNSETKEHAPAQELSNNGAAGYLYKETHPNDNLFVLHIPPKEAKLRIKHQCGFSFDRGDSYFSYSNRVAKFILTTTWQFLEKSSEGVTMEMKVMTIS